MKAIAGLVGGLVVAILASILYATTLAAIEPNGKLGAFSFVVLWASGLYVAIKSSSTALAWRELLLTAAILSFLLPVSGMLYTGSFMATKLNLATDTYGAQTAGAMIGGGFITALLGFAGFFLGVALLVTGLLLSRNSKEVFSETSPHINGEQTAKLGIFKNTTKGTKCPHCDGVVPTMQPECNHCLNRITWINGKPFRPSRPAD